MRILLVLLSATLTVGCKDKPKAQPPTNGAQLGSGSGSGSDGSGHAKAPDEPVANPGSGGFGPKVVELPKSDSKPPLKTAKKITLATLEKLSKIEFPSFTRDVRQLNDKLVEIKYTTKERPHLAAIVTVSPCFDCVPMDLAKWQAKKDSLKTFLAPELREHKETVFEVGATELFGAKLVYTYQVGWAFGKDPDTDQQMGAYSHAYVANFNDGVNQIRVNASYADDPVKTRDEMVALAPKEDLEKIAKRFLEYFTQQWKE